MEGTATGYRGRKLPDYNFIHTEETETQKVGQSYRCSKSYSSSNAADPKGSRTSANSSTNAIHMCQYVILCLAPLKLLRVQGHNDLSTSHRDILKWSQGISIAYGPVGAFQI